MVKKTIIIQSLIFDRSLDKFNCKRKVKNWILKKGYKIRKNKKDAIIKYKRSNTYRVRQEDPFKFNKSSFHTKKICKGIIAVLGKKKLK